jgi:hypothetical protein
MSRPFNPHPVATKSLLIFFLFLLALSFHLQAQDSLATVYFYRAGKFAGSFVGYDLKHGENVIGRIKSNSVVTYKSKPGDQVFRATTESESSIRLILEAGKTYFVECGISAGALVGRPTFRQAPNAEARRQINTIDAAIANVIPAMLEESIHPNDTTRALYNLFERKRKGGNTRSIVFALLGVSALINTATNHRSVNVGGQAIDVTPSNTGGYIFAGFSTIMMITGATQATTYSAKNRDKLLEDYRNGVQLPKTIKSNLRAKDFK